MSETTVTMSLKESRKAMLDFIVSSTDEDYQPQTVHFNNDDIPRFLIELSDLESKSRNSDLIVG